jgi:ABC-type multidrug transport system ATPase subunit
MFYDNYDTFRLLLGAVPQKDVVPLQLTARQALSYTARLRLPPNTPQSELRQRVQGLLQTLELAEHENKRISWLSGGQVKRVSLGAELLAEPALLYVDEVTSGLDPLTETRIMDLLAKQAKKEGRSVICVTHNLENVHLFDLLVLLVKGRLAYIGTRDEALAYFSPKPPGKPLTEVKQIYECLERKEPEEWESKFRDSEAYQKYVIAPRKTAALARKAVLKDKGAVPDANTASIGPAAPPAEREPSSFVYNTPPPATPPSRWATLLLQFAVLVGRSIRVLGADLGSTCGLIVLPVLLGMLLVLGFGNQSYDEVLPRFEPLEESERQKLIRACEALKAAGREAEAAKLARLLEMKPPKWPAGEYVTPHPTYLMLTVLVLVVLWLSCGLGAKEIVKEAPIYERERAFNLYLVPYVGSKFALLGTVVVVQAFLLVAVTFGGLTWWCAWRGVGGPPASYYLPFGSLMGMFALLALTGLSLGLLISALASSEEKATMWTLYVLIPQILLGGYLVSVEDSWILYALAGVLSPVYWAFRAVQRGVPQLPVGAPGYRDINDSVLFSCCWLVAQTLVFLGLTILRLGAKDRPRPHGDAHVLLGVLRGLSPIRGRIPR